MNEMNDYSNPATPLMSEKTCETCKYWMDKCIRIGDNWCSLDPDSGEVSTDNCYWKQKCTTCGDSGVVNEENPRTTQLEKVPCPDCTKPEEPIIHNRVNYGTEQPEQVEDIMDFVEPEEYLKPDEDRIREAFEEEYNTSGYQRMIAPIDCFTSGYKSALSDHEKQRNGDKAVLRHYAKQILKLKDTIKDLSGISEDHVSYLKALSDSEKEIEELKNAIDLMIEDRDSFHNNNLKLKDLLDKAVKELKHCDVFIQTREKMHPAGIKLYYETLKEIQEGRK